MKKHTKPIEPQKRPQYILLASLVLFAVCAILARNNILLREEQTVGGFIYNLPSWLAPIMFVVTLGGSTFIALVVVVLTYVFVKKKTAICMLFAVILSLLSVIFIKYFLDLPRPFEMSGTVISRELFVMGAAFPSGHTANATVLALGLYSAVKIKYRKLLIVWIIAVAFSRIYLGVHGVIDVVAGFAIGVAINQVLTIYGHKR